MLDSITPRRALHVYPNPSTRHQMMLAALGAQQWRLALRMALQGYHDIDPLLFIQAWHPVRVVHAWVLLRLLVQVAEVGVPDSEDIKWHLVIWRLWEEVEREVGKSHGAESKLSDEVAGFGSQLREGLERFRAAEGAEKAHSLMDLEWQNLKASVDKASQ